MTVEQIKNAVMFQTNNDTDDVGDFTPYLLDYINDGYDRLLYAYASEHTSDVADADYPRLSAETDVPLVPVWAHSAIVDYATYKVYQNGNATKQNRSVQFLGAFREIQSKLGNAPLTGEVKTFSNIPW